MDLYDVFTQMPLSSGGYRHCPILGCDACFAENEDQQFVNHWFEEHRAYISAVVLDHSKLVRDKKEDVRLFETALRKKEEE